MQSDLLWDLETTLGLPIAAVGGPEPGNPDLRGRVVYRAGAGTMLSVYERPLSRSEHTAAFFVIDDFDEIIAELRARGLALQDYELPHIQTEDGVLVPSNAGRRACRPRAHCSPTTWLATGPRPPSRAREFGEAVDHEAEKLHDASAEGQVAVRKRAAVDLAGRISEALGQIVLTRLGERAGRLAEGL